MNGSSRYGLPWTRADRQDYLFVRAFTTFTAALGELIPEAYTEIRSLVLKDGYESLLTERNVFQSNAKRRSDVQLAPTSDPLSNPVEESSKNATIHQDLRQYMRPDCYQYAEWMMNCVKGESKITSPATSVLLLWGIEKCYYDAFSEVKKSDRYESHDESAKKFVEWWTSSEFGKYIDTLQKAFEEMKNEDKEWDSGKGKAIMKTMLYYEKGFWASAFPVDL